MQTPNNKHWYVVHCKPQQQQRAEEHLHNQHFHCFNPTRPAQRKLRGKTEVVIEALFPNYLFIELDDHSNWSALRSTRGVSRIVSFNGRPTPMPDNAVEMLMEQCRRLHAGEPERLFKPGDRVLITEGCFRNIEAIVQANSAEDRVILLLNLMHSTHSVEQPVNNLAHA